MSYLIIFLQLSTLAGLYYLAMRSRETHNHFMNHNKIITDLQAVNLKRGGEIIDLRRRIKVMEDALSRSFIITKD